MALQRSFWQTIRSTVVGAVALAILGTVGMSSYDLGEIQVLKQEVATTSVERRIEKDEQRLDSVDKRLVALQENTEHPHTHGVPCTCVGSIGKKAEEIQISLGADCDARAIEDLKKAFPSFRCHPAE